MSNVQNLCVMYVLLARNIHVLNIILWHAAEQMLIQFMIYPRDQRKRNKGAENVYIHTCTTARYVYGYVLLIWRTFLSISSFTEQTCAQMQTNGYVRYLYTFVYTRCWYKYKLEFLFIYFLHKKDDSHDYIEYKHIYKLRMLCA